MPQAHELTFSNATTHPAHVTLQQSQNVPAVLAQVVIKYFNSLSLGEQAIFSILNSNIVYDTEDMKTPVAPPVSASGATAGNDNNTHDLNLADVLADKNAQYWMEIQNRSFCIWPF